MVDGIVRTIMEARHVPKLKKNLISLDVLDSSGYKYIGQVGPLKVSKRNLLVMNSRKIGNIYKLEGKTEMCKVAVIS